MQTISEKALQRRLKRRITAARHNFFALCSPGFESVLLEEVKSLNGVDNLSSTRGGVSFSGALDTVYFANLFLNTAHRVLVRVGEFSAHSFPMLFDQVQRVEWELWVPNGGSYRLRVSSKRSKLNMKQRLIETCEEAIENRLSSLGLSASSENRSPLEFVLRLMNNRATLSFNTSGVHLHKRGYKTFSVPAPIRETLACSILLRCNYNDYDLVVDPFCGSGTFLLEAARMAIGRPAGVGRDFAFVHSLFFNEKKYERIRRVEENVGSIPRLLGFDISLSAVRAARMNASNAGLDQMLAVEQSAALSVDFSSLGELGEQRLLISNPPYGERLEFLGAGEVETIEMLIQRLSGWRLVLLSKTNLLDSQLSSSAKQHISQGNISMFYNGGSRTYLHIFDVRA